MVHQAEIDVYITENFRYEDGWIYRTKNSGNSKEGSRIGHPHKSSGYMVVGILNKKFMVHRVAYYLCHGYWPDLIDHLDRDKHNNRIENLVSSTESTNSLNVQDARIDSISGVLGVKKTASGKYSAQVCRELLGCYKTLKEAKHVVDVRRNEILAERRAKEIV